jgi:hypothetical protein
MTTFRLDPAGDEALLLQLAKGFAEFGEEVAGAISQLAPRNTGRYARSIKATTFLEGGIYSGPAVRGTGVKSTAQIWTVVWTGSKLGHLLELGTKPRVVAAKDGGMMAWPADKYGPAGAARVVHQPGTARQPHFWPGFASVVGRAGEIIGHGAKMSRGRVNVKVL